MAVGNIDKLLPPKQAGIDRLLTSKEVAEILGIKRETLAVWRCQGRYPDLCYIRVGNHVRYELSTVKNWIESRTVGDAKDEGLPD